MNIQTLRNERVTLCECVATNFYCDEKFVVFFFSFAGSTRVQSHQHHKREREKNEKKWDVAFHPEREKRSLRVRGGAKKKKNISLLFFFLLSSSSEKSLLVLPVQQTHKQTNKHRLRKMREGGKEEESLGEKFHLVDFCAEIATFASCFVTSAPSIKSSRDRPRRRLGVAQHISRKSLLHAVDERSAADERMPLR